MSRKMNTGGSAGGGHYVNIFSKLPVLPPPRKEPPIRIELGESRSGMDLVQKRRISSSSRESNPDSSAVELIASHCTDWAILAPTDLQIEDVNISLIKPPRTEGYEIFLALFQSN
jgi:hypothetical protein